VCEWRGGGGELHMKELCVHYPNVLAELQFLHYIKRMQYYSYRNAFHLSGLTFQSLLVTFLSPDLVLKNSTFCPRIIFMLHLDDREQTVIIFLYSLN